MRKVANNHINDAFTRSVFGLAVFCVIFLIFNGAYLSAITGVEFALSKSIEDIQYQYIFALHLALGALLTLAFLAYLSLHLLRVMRKTHRIKRPVLTRGAWLALTWFSVIISGLLLTRGIAILEVATSFYRQILYALHLLLPFIGILLLLKHRGLALSQLFTKPIAYASALSVLPLVIFSFYDTINSKDTSNSAYISFQPSFIKLNADTPIDASQLMLDAYCRECHADTHDHWQASAHRFSSFNNPFYRASLNNARRKLISRDGDVTQSRLCAGCHDIVPLLSGMFDRPDFDLDSHASASAGITCTVCHAITSIDSRRGNADYTVTPPTQYPFASSSSPLLHWFSNILVKSNPDFHKKTFLKPLHQQSEFCGACHKVHIPESVNHYRWLRGQNHYDSFILSGVSGHNMDSFYYPPVAKKNCQECHMQQIDSNDLGTKISFLSGKSSMSDHFFPAANTALTETVHKCSKCTVKHQEFLRDALSIDIIGVREGGTIDGKFYGPDELKNMDIKSGASYLLEVVVRNKEVGHSFTNGTADSNQVWLSIDLSVNGKVVATNGELDSQNRLDMSNTHMIRTYLVDHEGNAIDKRNGEDIYTMIYDHQIRPGACDVIHYRFTMPEPAQQPLVASAELKYRKFDSGYTRLSLPHGKVNKLPVTLISQTKLTLTPAGGEEQLDAASISRRLNDYGIALMLKPAKSHFRQAEEIFKEVAELGNEQGSLNLLRLYYLDGRLDLARNQLSSIKLEALDNIWSVEWYSALLNIDYGNLAPALKSLLRLLETDWPEARARGMDFAFNYPLRNKIALVYYLLAQQEAADSAQQKNYMDLSKTHYRQVLELDPENLAAHYGMYKIALYEKDNERSAYHLAQYKRYKPDDEASGRVAALSRLKSRNLDEQASPTAVYPLY